MAHLKKQAGKTNNLKNMKYISKQNKKQLEISKITKNNKVIVRKSV